MNKYKIERRVLEFLLQANYPNVPQNYLNVIFKYFESDFIETLEDSMKIFTWVLIELSKLNNISEKMKWEQFEFILKNYPNIFENSKSMSDDNYIKKCIYRFFLSELERLDADGRLAEPNTR